MTNNIQIGDLVRLKAFVSPNDPHIAIIMNIREMRYSGCDPNKIYILKYLQHSPFSKELIDTFIEKINV